MPRFIPLLVLLAACESSNLADVPSGSFVLYDAQGADGAERENADVLELDIAALTWAVQYDDGSPTASGALTLLPEDRWIDDCYTMDSHTTTRAYTLDADVLTIAGYELPAPELSAKCGGRPLLWSTETEGAPDTGLVLAFDPEGE